MTSKAQKACDEAKKTLDAAKKAYDTADKNDVQVLGRQGKKTYEAAKKAYEEAKSAYDMAKDALEFVRDPEGKILEKAGTSIQSGRTGAAAGAAGLGIAAATAGTMGAAGNALTSANGVVAGHAMAWGVSTIGAKQTGMILSKAGGASAAAVILPIGIFGYQFACDVKKWYDGKIDSQTLAENSTNNLGAIAGGVAAGAGAAYAGAYVGAAFGPVGAMVGAIGAAVLAGVAGAWAGEAVTKKAFDAFFDGPADQRARLRKAYSVLGLDSNASPEQVGKRYKALALKHHPDKGGDHAKFIQVNAAYEVIRAAYNVSNQKTCWCCPRPAKDGDMCGGREGCLYNQCQACDKSGKRCKHPIGPDGNPGGHIHCPMHR